MLIRNILNVDDLSRCTLNVFKRKERRKLPLMNKSSTSYKADFALYKNCRDKLSLNFQVAAELNVTAELWLKTVMEVFSKRGDMTKGYFFAVNAKICNKTPIGVKADHLLTPLPSCGQFFFNFWFLTCSWEILLYPEYKTASVLLSKSFECCFIATLLIRRRSSVCNISRRKHYWYS